MRVPGTILRGVEKRLELPVRDRASIDVEGTDANLGAMMAARRILPGVLHVDTHRITAFDLPGNPYGVADVVSDEFLPFPNSTFDLVLCIEAFHYVPDPARGVAELARVLRPGGHAVVAVPLVWEYDRSQLERRFTGPELEALFQGWNDVSVLENGGRGVAWATLTGSIANMVEWHVPERFAARRAARPAFAAFYLLVNSIGTAIDRAERRYARSSLALPMNLLVTAKRP